jgi:putative colanic acid biosynthesis acetyltransferase WcaF
MHSSSNLDISMSSLDPNRFVASPHSTPNRIARSLWNVCAGLLYRPSPRAAHRYRVLLLRLFGARVHWTAHPYPKCRIWLPKNLTMDAYSCLADDVDCYNVATIEIGSFAIVSQYSYLCTATHDYNDPNLPLQSKPIKIGERSWVCARATVQPGVTLGEGSILALGSIATRDLEPWMIYGGVPAKKIKERVMNNTLEYADPEAV